MLSKEQIIQKLGQEEFDQFHRDLETIDELKEMRSEEFAKNGVSPAYGELTKSIREINQFLTAIVESYFPESTIDELKNAVRIK